MDISSFSRICIVVMTIITMLISQFAPVGLNMTYAAAPMISSISIPTGNYKIGDTIMITVVADAAGYTADAASINGVDVRASFADNTDNSYSLSYVIASGDTDIGGAATPTASITLTDGSNSTTYSTVTESGGDVIIDAHSPTLLITDDEAGTANIASGAVVYTFTFTEAVTGFDIADIAIVGGSGSILDTVSPTTYTLAITPLTNSVADITVDIAGSVALDMAGNSNTAATQSVQHVDTLKPTIVISTSAPSPTNSDFTVTATFSEPVTGVALNDFFLTNGYRSSFSGVSSTVYTILVTPLYEGMVTVDMGNSIAQDVFGNPNTLSNQITRIYDTIAPIVSLSGAPTQIIAFGSTFSDGSATWTDDQDGTGTISIASSGSVDSSIAGVYTLQYWKIDAAGNMSNTITRTVTVSAQLNTNAGGGGGGGGGSSSYLTPIIPVVQTGSVIPILTPTITIATDSLITQGTFIKKVAEFKKSKVINIATTLSKGTRINVFFVLPNGKLRKVGTTRVLKNGGIRFVVKTAGTYKFVQK